MNRMYWYQTICFFLGCSLVFASVNLSLNRPTSQSSIFVNNQGNLSSERAVDGKYDTVKNELSCAVTKSKDRQVFWQVRLAEESIISHIHFVFESTSEIVKILQNHRVHISNQSKLRSGIECYRETRKTPGLINEVYCLGVGRYVTYYSDQLFNGRVALLLICEVEVYGCPVGTYGFQCRLSCSSNCMSQPCEPDFGHCIGSCKAGFVGDRCDRVCPTGFYGTGCALRCSPGCLNNNCFNTNGSCMQCVEGLTGDTCTISTGTASTTTSTDPTVLSPVTDEAFMDGISLGNYTKYYIIAITVLAVALVLFIILFHCFRRKSRNMEKVLAAYNISTINKSVKHENLGEDDPNYQSPDDKNCNPALSMSRLKHNTFKSTNSTLIYDQPSTNYDGGNYSDGKNRNDGTLSYANSKFGTDPALNYEALQRDGIYPRESKHIYDPIHS